MGERPQIADHLDLHDLLLYRYRLSPTPAVEYISDSIVNLLGYPIEAYDDPDIPDHLVHPQDRPTLELLLSGKAPADRTLSMRFRRIDGTFVWAETRAAYIRDSDGNAVAVEGVVRDVTAQKRAEQRMAVQYAVTKTLAQAETLLDAAPDVLRAVGEMLDWDCAVLWTLDGDRLRHVAGWQPPAAGPSSLLAASAQMTLSRGQGAPGEAWATGQTIWLPKVSNYAGFKRPDAARRDGISSGVAFPISLGEEQLGVIELFSRDERQPDGDLIQLVTNLGSQVGQFIERRRAEHERKILERQFYEAQKMEAVGHLAGGVAHDFNNLLTAILGYCELLLEGLEPSHPLRVDIEEIRRAGETAASLTRQLLTFSRRELLQSELLNLNKVVQGVEKLLRRLIGENITIDLRLDPAVPVVRADPSQMEQVIMNLAVNARDAMPSGGLLTIETSTISVDEGFSRTHMGIDPGRYVSLIVCDTGEGMSPEVQTRLFEPFFTTKDRGKGTGLGLATVYGIVKQSHGHISVMSSVGRGTTFTILLPPAEQTRRRSAAAPVAHVAQRTGGARILLVDDDEAIRDLGRRLLERQGYRVIVAATGPAAVEAARAQDGGIDLLLTDLLMPGGMSGSALAREVVRLHPGVKLLFTSGYTDEAIDDHVDGERLFLDKPFTPDALLRKVREALDA